MKLILATVALLLALRGTNQLVCPRTEHTGNYLNYLQLFFQEDDQLLSFSNANSELVRMWFYNSTAADFPGTGYKDVMYAWLVRDKSYNARAYLIMLWVIMNEDKTFYTVVNYGKFWIDPKEFADVNAPTSTIKNLFITFFNQNLDQIIIDSDNYNSVMRLCANTFTNDATATVANPVTKEAELCLGRTPATELTYGLILNPTASPALTSGCLPTDFIIGKCSCTYTSKTTSTPASCTFTLNARVPGTYTHTAINSWNGNYVLKVPGAHQNTIGSHATLVFNLDNTETPYNPYNSATIKNCHPKFSKLEYDHYYYLFSNYYRKGIGQQAPVPPTTTSN